MRRLSWLLPLAALIAVLPLWIGGDSCGKDFTFHMQSWLGAAEQLRHGVVYPRWNFLAAYNAGDPRFIFYPPLSWELGALLSLVLPFSLVPTVLTWIILSIAGFSMFRLTRAFVPEPLAFVAACVFLANPFMLWTITGRNAYAELLAAAFCPLLISAMLSTRISSWRIGLPLALMWLSNVPGGAIGTYLAILLAAIRLLSAIPGRTPMPWLDRLKLLLFPTLLYAGGILYGFALAGFYLLPALWERREIHMADAFGIYLRPTDNLFFHRASQPTDDFFLRTEHIAVALALGTLAALAIAWLGFERRQPLLNKDTATVPHPAASFAPPVTALTLAVLFMMTFLAAPIWRHIPALWVVQFPWRLLFVLGACFAAAVALALRDLPLSSPAAAGLGLAVVAALALPLVKHTRVVCTSDRTPRAIYADLLRHHTPEPTDEYVVATGDADFLRPDNPPYWMAPNPTDYAPGTTPNPAATNLTQEWPPVPEQARLRPTPLQFTVSTPAAAYLVVNLQTYPNWRIARNGSEPLPHLPRRDGLLTVSLPAGTSSLTITWHPSWDEYLGFAVSIAALLAFWLRATLIKPGGTPSAAKAGAHSHGFLSWTKP